MSNDTITIGYKSVATLCAEHQNLAEYVRQMETEIKKAHNVDMHLAAVLLNRFEPLAPHHVGWIREHLGYLTDEDLKKVVQTGKWPRKG